MDIFEYGKSIDFSADYYDMHTGYIYHLTEYGRALKFFGITELGIRVSENGTTIGYVHPEQ